MNSHKFNYYSALHFSPNMLFCSKYTVSQKRPTFGLL